MGDTTNSCHIFAFIANFTQILTLLNVFYYQAIQVKTYLVLTFMWITKKIKPKIKQRQPRTIYAIPKNGFFPPIQDGVVKINCFFPLNSFTGKSKPKMTVAGILISWQVLSYILPIFSLFRVKSRSSQFQTSAIKLSLSSLSMQKQKNYIYFHSYY